MFKHCMITTLHKWLSWLIDDTLTDKLKANLLGMRWVVHLIIVIDPRMRSQVQKPIKRSQGSDLKAICEFKSEAIIYYAVLLFN